MNAAGTRSVLFMLATAIAGAASGNTPGSFGSPSLLPDSFGSTEVATWYTHPSAAQDVARPTGRPVGATTSQATRSGRPVFAPAALWSDAPEQAAATGASGRSAFQGDAWIDPHGDCCADPVCGPAVCCPSWYVGVNALILTRNHPRFAQISFDDTDLIGQVLSTDTGLSRWNAGPEVKVGWMLSPLWALEFTYWGLYGDNVESVVYAANLVGNLNSALDFSPLNIGFDNVNDLYDGAQAHRIRRDYDVNNFELNLIGGRMPWFDGRTWRVSYLAGIRYLRFAEEFQYASADTVPIFGADLDNEVYYDINVRNNLWGAQVGGRADWFWTERFSLYLGAKFGIYGNSMGHHSRIHNINGTAEVGPGNPLAGELFDISSGKTTTSFIGELDLGLSYQFTQHWSAVIGYRALAISGIAYATDQIPSNLADLPGVADIDCNAHLILHGGYAGAVYSW